MPTGIKSLRDSACEKQYGLILTPICYRLKQHLFQGFASLILSSQAHSPKNSLIHFVGGMSFYQLLGSDPGQGKQVFQRRQEPVTLTDTGKPIKRYLEDPAKAN